MTSHWVQQRHQKLKAKDLQEHAKGFTDSSASIIKAMLQQNLASKDVEVIDPETKQKTLIHFRLRIKPKEYSMKKPDLESFFQSNDVTSYLQQCADPENPLRYEGAELARQYLLFKATKRTFDLELVDDGSLSSDLGTIFNELMQKGPNNVGPIAKPWVDQYRDNADLMAIRSKLKELKDKQRLQEQALFNQVRSMDLGQHVV